MKIVLIGVAGAAGALTRYGIATVIGVRTFPWSTFVINITGSFLLGLLLALAIERQWSETVVIPLAVGFLGAYTTFSTFEYETFTLLRSDRVPTAALYIGLSVGTGLLAALAGYSLARRMT